MSKKLTHEEFMEKFYKQNKNAENIEILGEYVNSRTKIKVRCKIDGYEWETTPSNLLRGYGCPKCKSNKEKKTHEEFVNEMNKINSNIEILGEYVNTRTKIKCKCKIDGHEWEATPNNLLHGYGCLKCYNNRRGENKKITHDEFVDRMKKINNNIEILGEYKGSHTKIKCKCKIDGHEWEATPNSLLKGQGCPKCGIKSRVEKRNKTTEYFINELKEINKNIEVLGEYINDRTKIKVRCKKDGHEWEVRPNSLLHGYGCPKCNESKGEKRVAKFLNDKNIEYISQYKFDECKSKYKLPFDFYIPSLNIAIEYDGEDHYRINKRSKNDTYERAFNKFVGTKVRDTIKTIYCKENNIKLIRIPYWDFDNIEEILEKELED